MKNVHGSNLDGDSDYSESFVDFLRPSKKIPDSTFKSTTNVLFHIIPNSSLTTHHFQFIIHYTSLPIHHSLHITSNSSFTIHHFQFIIHYTSLPIHHSLHITSNSSFTTHHFQFIIHYTSLPIHHSLYIISNSSFTTHHSQFIIHYTSLPIHHSLIILPLDATWSRLLKGSLNKAQINKFCPFIHG
jgi:hypothetical protein